VGNHEHDLTQEIVGSESSIRAAIMKPLGNLHAELKKLFQFQLFLCGCRSVPELCGKLGDEVDQAAW
jgi:hypothetical protein